MALLKNKTNQNQLRDQKAWRHNLLHIGETNVYNLGTNSGNSVKEIFGLCERILGQQIFLKIMPRREGDPAILVANNQKIAKELSWTPQKTLEDSIKTTLQWERQMV